MNNLEVNCYSGYTYAERPRSFRGEGIQYEVEKIEKSWQEPGEKHFQMRTGVAKSSDSAIMRGKGDGRWLSW